MKLDLLSKIRQRLLQLIRRLLSQNGRNKTLNVIELMQCNHCGYNDLFEIDGTLVCKKCEYKYYKFQGFYKFT